ncbi:MAG: hypothetical protein ACRD22_01970 [Terriglobia bacterium]
MPGALAPGSNWTELEALATMAAAVCAAVAAGFSGWQVRVSKKTTKLQVDSTENQMFNSIFHFIQEHEDQFYADLNVVGAKKAHRDRMFFNAVNYLAFLIESKILQRRDFFIFYSDAFLYWWEMFEREVPEVDRYDPGKYQEFKRVVGTIRERKLPSASRLNTTRR